MKQFENFHQSATVSVTKDGDRVCDGLRIISTVILGHVSHQEQNGLGRIRKNGLAGVGMTLEKVYDWE